MCSCMTIACHLCGSPSGWCSCCRAPGSQRSAAKPITPPQESSPSQPAPPAPVGNHQPPYAAYSTSPISIPEQQQPEPNWPNTPAYSSTELPHMQWQAAQHLQQHSGSQAEHPSLWKPHPEQLAQVQQQAWDRAPGRREQQPQTPHALQPASPHEQLPPELYAQLPEPWNQVHDSISPRQDSHPYPPELQYGHLSSPASPMTSQTLDEHMHDAPPAQHARSASGQGPPPGWGSHAGSGRAKSQGPGPPGFARALPTSHPPGFAAQSLRRQASVASQPSADSEPAPAEQQRAPAPPPRPVSFAQDPAVHQLSGSSGPPQAWGYPQQQQFKPNGPVPLNVAGAPPRPLSQPGSYTPQSPQGADKFLLK